jgi:DNA topoisomerase-2
MYRDTGSRIKITELPPGRWTQDYKEHLDSLIEKKMITGYTNNSTTDDVDFEIFGYSGKDLLKDLKMRKTFHTSNMHLFHPTRGIHRYTTPEDILKDFVELRLEHYKKRKAHLIDVLEKRAEMCSLKSKFVTMVIEGRLVVFKRKKAELEKEMAAMFPKMDGNWDYLLNTRTVEYTEERVKALMDEAQQAIVDLECMLKTSHITMWKTDIKNI